MIDDQERLCFYLKWIPRFRLLFLVTGYGFLLTLGTRMAGHYLLEWRFPTYAAIATELGGAVVSLGAAAWMEQTLVNISHGKLLEEIADEVGVDG